MAVLAMSAALPCGTVFRALRSAAADQVRSRLFNFSNRRTRPPSVVTLRSALCLLSTTMSCVHCACADAPGFTAIHATLAPSVLLSVSREAYWKDWMLSVWILNNPARRSLLKHISNWTSHLLLSKLHGTRVY